MKKKTASLLLFLLSVAFAGNDVKSSSVVGIWVNEKINIKVCEGRKFEIDLVKYINPELKGLRFFEQVLVASPTTTLNVAHQLKESGKLSGFVSSNMDSRKDLVIRAVWDNKYHEDGFISLETVICR